MTARALPPRVHLPSGRVVRISDDAARRAAADRGRELGPWMRELAVLEGEGVLSDDGGARLDPARLSLRDAHVLFALLAYAGVIDEEAAPYTCENCGATFSVAPSSLLEIGPFVDGELADPDLDARFAFDRAWPTAPLGVGRAAAKSVRFSDRTVEDVLPLWRAAASHTLCLTPSVIAAMGVTALGRERCASAIADALATAPSELWREVVDLWHEAHYSARLVGVYRCASCGARNDLDVPLERELPRELPSTAERPFPDADAFEARVREAAAPIYARRGVRNVDLVVDEGVPVCDDGGEPLLGSYLPGGEEGGIPRRPEIRLYYRSFRAQQAADATFVLDDEIRETLDHELTHHLHHLAGDDPLDEEEREEIDREQMRLVGRGESGRRARQRIALDLTGFLRVTWPLWLLVAAVTAFEHCR